MGQGLRISGFAAAVLAAGALQAQTAPQPGEPMRPRGAWTAAFEESACVLSRSYGEGAGAMQLAFRPGPSDRSLEIAVIAPHTGKDFSSQGDAEAVLLPSGQHAKSYYRDYTIAGGKRVLRFSVARDELSDLTTAASIKLIRNGQLPLHFALTNTANAMATIQTCQDDLMRGWGLDPVALRGLTRKLEPVRPEEWIKPGDYPQEALRAGQQGETEFQLTVDADGHATACIVTRSSGTKQLDDTVCALLLKRARFKPALGADGKPIGAPWPSRFRWSIPDGR